MEMKKKKRKKKGKKREWVKEADGSNASKECKDGVDDAGQMRTIGPDQFDS
jgi:hypothetical protein